VTTDRVDPQIGLRAELDAASARGNARPLLPRLLAVLRATSDAELFTTLGEQMLSITRREAALPLASATATVEAALSTPLPEGFGAAAQRELRTRHAALPLHAAHLFLWGLARTGEILRMDLDLFALPVDVEDDERTRFRVLLQGLDTCAALAAFLPAAPARVQACAACRTRGFDERGECLRCEGFGW
jgi:hypothetical protein